MHKKLIALALSTLSVWALCSPSALAALKEDEQAQLAEKIKSAVAKLGTGPDARIEVKLHDKTRLKGYIREANAENFVLVDDKTGDSTQITYPQVKQAKGRNRLSGDKILAVAIIGFIVAAYVIGYARCGKNC